MDTGNYCICCMTWAAENFHDRCMAHQNVRLYGFLRISQSAGAHDYHCGFMGFWSIRLYKLIPNLGRDDNFAWSSTTGELVSGRVDPLNWLDIKTLIPFALGTFTPCICEVYQLGFSMHSKVLLSGTYWYVLLWYHKVWNCKYHVWLWGWKCTSIWKI